MNNLFNDFLHALCQLDECVDLIVGDLHLHDRPCWKQPCIHGLGDTVFRLKRKLIVKSTLHSMI